MGQSTLYTDKIDFCCVFVEGHLTLFLFLYSYLICNGFQFVKYSFCLAFHATFLLFFYRGMK
jgi:hypothetical protein